MGSLSGGDGVQGAADFQDGAAGYVGVALGGTEGGMAQEFLDVTNIGAIFKKVGGKGVAEAMDRDGFVDLGVFKGLDENVLGGSD